MGINILHGTVLIAGLDRMLGSFESRAGIFEEIEYVPFSIVESFQVLVECTESRCSGKLETLNPVWHGIGKQEKLLIFRATKGQLL